MAIVIKWFNINLIRIKYIMYLFELNIVLAIFFRIYNILLESHFPEKYFVIIRFQTNIFSVQNMFSNQ